MPSLPPNLDDRHFQDIVDEAKRLIPRSPRVDEPQPQRPRRRADRAVRLDERDDPVPVNQVPDRMYVAVPQPRRRRAVPAERGEGRSHVLAVARRPALGRPCRAGPRSATTERRPASPRSCSPRRSTCVIEPARAGRGAHAAARRETGSSTSGMPCGTYRARPSRASRPTPIPSGDSFYLGFAARSPARVLQLDVTARRRASASTPSARRSRAEVWSGRGLDASAVRARTPRVVSTATGSSSCSSRSPTSRSRWRTTAGSGCGPGSPPRGNQPTYRTSPRICTLLIRSLGGTVPSEHADTVTARGDRPQRRVGRPGVPGVAHARAPPHLG